MNGTPEAIVRNGRKVHVFIADGLGVDDTPTQFVIECHSEGHAKLVAAQWRKVWEL